MYTPKHLIRIFYSHCDLVCLGSQLNEIIDFLQPFLPKHVWFGANISVSFTSGNTFREDSYTDFSLKKIGSISEFKNELSVTDQFMSGVFIAIKTDCVINSYTLIKVDTEDSEFRQININGVIVEIRTFDTSYFEIYSEDYALMKKISEKFNCEINEHQ